MTALGTHRDSDELAENPYATYDLIICRHDQIVFHDHYETPEQRLSQCVGILTASDVLASTITAERASLIHELRNKGVAQWRTNADGIVNDIAKLCRGWGVQVYESTTSKRSAAPRVLFSVITEYGPGQTVAEHFPDRESRSASLIERAEHFFAAPGHIPGFVLSDEQRLAALVATFLMPATVTLTEAALDEADGVYRPTGFPLCPTPDPSDTGGEG